MIFVHFQGKPFRTTVIQVYALTSNAEEVEIEQFYEDLQDVLETRCFAVILVIMVKREAKLEISLSENFF